MAQLCSLLGCHYHLCKLLIKNFLILNRKTELMTVLQVVFSSCYIPLYIVGAHGVIGSYYALA